MEFVIDTFQETHYGAYVTSCNVADIVLDYLKYNESWSDDEYPENGFLRSVEKPPIRNDYITVGTLHCMYFRESRITGVVNINIYNTDLDRIMVHVKKVQLMMDNALLDVLYFERDLKPILLSRGKKLKFMNLRYRFELGSDKIEFNIATEDFKIIR